MSQLPRFRWLFLICQQQKKSQKWGSCGVIKVFLTLWQLQLLKGFFYYNLSIESDTSADKVLLKERAFEHLAQNV